MKGLAIVLIVLGLVGLIYGGVSWTRREKVVDFGSVEVTHDKREAIPLPPVVGGILLLGGIAILVSQTRTSSHA